MRELRAKKIVANCVVKRKCKIHFFGFLKRILLTGLGNSSEKMRLDSAVNCGVQAVNSVFLPISPPPAAFLSCPCMPQDTRNRHSFPKKKQGSEEKLQPLFNCVKNKLSLR